MTIYNILDFDQTLFNTRKALLCAYLEAFKHVGYTLDPMILINNEGKNIDCVFDILNIDVSKRREIKEYKRYVYQSYYSLIEPNIQLLSLANKVIVSNASQIDIKKILDYFKVSDIISIYGREQMERLKPDPSVFIECFTNFGIHNHYCIYDDQKWGLLSAERAAKTLSMLNQISLFLVDLESNSYYSI